MGSWGYFSVTGHSEASWAMPIMDHPSLAQGGMKLFCIVSHIISGDIIGLVTGVRLLSSCPLFVFSFVALRLSERCLACVGYNMNIKND